MLSLILASACFLGIHLFISGTRLRDVIVARIGDRAYLALFSLSSLGAIIWMSMGYRAAPHVEIWAVGAGLKHTVYALMLPAVFLVVTGLASPNPTATGGTKLLEGKRAARGIITVTRHPFLWGIAIWGLAHLLANGDVAALIFFGAFALLALLGPHLIDAKLAKREPEAWARFAAETSWLPFQALLQKRTSFRAGEIGWWRLGLAVVVYLLLLAVFHEWVIGIALVTF